MKLVSIDGRIRALDGPFDAPGTGAIDLAALTGLPSGACRFLGAHGVEAARDKIGRATDIMPIAGVSLDPPIPKPRMIWAVGLNYRDHAAESGRAVPSAPTLFSKSPGALIGHQQPIVIPPHVEHPDYEGEVAVVIGRTARDVSERDALDYVAGITAAHDVSSRDHQYTTGQFTWSKSFDTFCPLGPEIATIDEVDVSDITIETRLNGEVVQSSNTSELVFSIPTLVAWISQGTTLLPGDIILTGTPAGVGAGRTPPRWLLDGDIVEITVGGLATLRNTVVRKPRGSEPRVTIRWSSRVPLDRPVLVAAFEGWNDAGNAASDAVRFLAHTASAVELATLDPQEWLDFQAARPVVTITDGVVQTTTWPSIRFLASPTAVSNIGRDLLLLVGPEPNLRWPAFSAEIVAVARELGCELAVTLGALLADVPHTRAIPVTGTASDPETVAQLGLSRSRYEGPTGIVGVLSDSLRRAGLSSASLWASVPHYVATPPNPRATHALLERLATLLDVTLPLRSLEIAGAAWVHQVDEVAAGDDDISRYVHDLEIRHDAAADDDGDDGDDDIEPRLDEISEEDLPSGESLAEDFERFLRDQLGNDD